MYQEYLTADPLRRAQVLDAFVSVDWPEGDAEGNRERSKLCSRALSKLYRPYELTAWLLDHKESLTQAFDNPNLPTLQPFNRVIQALTYEYGVFAKDLDFPRPDNRALTAGLIIGSSSQDVRKELPARIIWEGLFSHEPLVAGASAKEISERFLSDPPRGSMEEIVSREIQTMPIDEIHQDRWKNLADKYYNDIGTHGEHATKFLIPLLIEKLKTEQVLDSDSYGYICGLAYDLLYHPKESQAHTIQEPDLAQVVTRAIAQYTSQIEIQPESVNPSRYMLIFILLILKKNSNIRKNDNVAASIANLRTHAPITSSLPYGKMERIAQHRSDILQLFDQKF